MDTPETGVKQRVSGQFVPGDPRINRKGRRDAPADKLRKLFERNGRELVTCDVGDDGVLRLKRIEALVRQCYDLGAAGDTRALNIIFERLGGKAIQPTIADVKLSGTISMTPAEFAREMLKAQEVHED
jgi:hypothetical protein